MLGLTLEEFESSTEQISQMALDAVDNITLVLESIDNNTDKKKLELWNKTPIEPKFVDLPADPLKPLEAGEILAPSAPSTRDQDSFMAPEAPKSGGGFNWSAALGIVGGVAAGFAFAPLALGTGAAAFSGSAFGIGSSVGSGVGKLFSD
jgi:hypothetical protein